MGQEQSLDSRCTPRSRSLPAGMLGMAITVLFLSAAAGRAASGDRVGECLGRLPLRFEENRGQTAPEVSFLARGSGYGIFVTPGEAVLVLGPDSSGRGVEKTVLRLRLLGADRSARLHGRDELPGRSHYFIGRDPAAWRTEVPGYSRVELAEPYPGVDLAFYGRERRLEYDFIVSACADPAVIGRQLRHHRQSAPGEQRRRRAGGRLRSRRRQ